MCWYPHKGFALDVLTCILICSVVVEVNPLFSINGTAAEESHWRLDLPAIMAVNLESKTSMMKLLDGHTIPVFGLGVFQAKANGETEQAVLWALKHGYRLIDTAALYK